ncbi:AAA family ATPase [Desulfoluna butyratoxydans]|uniref:Signal transduction response regulator c-terminal effector n=1 Tax=Desulfoluna butyratoxydans TaxID=231438 RepID=A0A4U8YL21_9BACT|nr:AAA family ATPase [Desulfoluna butyratoxydans]VFQ44227.1 signal transduction response regulator c-terminal effector [Desulfoluna butyratoxydans]
MSHSGPVIRHDALSHCRMLFSGDFRLLVMVARAGQGKTTLARQFMDSAPSFWHACTPSESDPSVFTDRLSHSLGLPSLPEGGSPENRSEQALARLVKAAPDLGPGLLIVDDYHLVMDNPANRTCLQQLLAHSPLHMVILTREYPDHVVLAPLGDTLFIDNDLLALSLDETAQVVQAAGGDPAAAHAIRDIHALTEGWPGGVRLILEHGRLSSRPLTRHLPELSGSRILGAMDLLWTEASPRMALLAGLERIPAGILTDDGPWRVEGELLSSLAARACFVRIQKDKEGEWVILHHLLREAFAARKSSLTQAFCRRWAEVLGAGCIERGLVEEGLLCLSREGCHQKLAGELSAHGLALLGRGRFALVASLLDALSPWSSNNFPWLDLFRGIILLTEDPVSARQWLEQSLDGMRGAGDEKGELHAIGRLVEYEVLHGGAYGRLAPDIRRASALLETIDLAAHHRRHILAALTLGACYALDGAAAHGLLRLLEPELRAGGEDHLDLFSLLVPCLNAILRTDVPCALAELDARVAPERMAGLSPSSRFAVHFCLVNILRIRGRDDDFSLAGRYVKTHFTPFLSSPYLVKMTRTWDALAALRRGRAKEALGIFDEVLETSGGQDNLHAVTLSWKALCLAHLGRHHEARALSTEIGRVGDLGCGHYYARHCAMIQGCSRSLDPADADAVSNLARHTSTHTIYEDASIQALGLGYLARRHLVDGEGSAAMGAVTDMLSIMETVDCRNFSGFEPRIFTPMLTAAVSGGTERQRAFLAARQMLGVDLLDDGSAVPVLDIRPAPGGRLEVFCPSSGKSVAVRAAQQVRLLTLLLGEPGTCMAAHRLADLIWPGKEPGGLRGRLDNLMKRLRQTLATALDGTSPRAYLAIDAGTAVLRHVRCEAARLDDLLEEGRLILEQKRPWTASVLLTRAFSLLKDPAPFAPDAREVRGAALAWCPVLAQTHGTDRALDVARCALSFLPLSPSLNRLIHDLCLDADRPHQALEQVDRFRKDLRRAGHSFEEQEAVMESFWG